MFNSKTSLLIINPDQEIQQKLTRKSQEYIERGNTIFQYWAPEQIPPRETYKKEIMNELVTKGRINLNDFATKLEKKYGWLDERYYLSAAQIITDYNETQGQNVHGGTGLK